MAQIDKLFTSIWHNTTTGPGTPLTGLSATITIRDKSTNTIVVNNQAMTEIGLGEYDYTFATMDATKPYSYVMNPNTTLAYVTTGFVDPRISNLDKNLSQINGGGMRGGASDFDANDRKLIKETHEKVMTLENADFSETNSHIELAKSETIDKIESIELPEIDNTEIVKGIGVIKAQNTKLSNYIKGEEGKEKIEMEKRHKKMMDDMEECYAEMEKEKSEEISSKDELIKQMDEVSQEIIEEMEGEAEKKGRETIETIKSLLK